jgi:hypothetical protein
MQNLCADVPGCSGDQTQRPSSGRGLLPKQNLFEDRKKDVFVVSILCGSINARQPIFLFSLYAQNMVRPHRAAKDCANAAINYNLYDSDSSSDESIVGESGDDGESTDPEDKVIHNCDDDESLDADDVVAMEGNNESTDDDEDMEAELPPPLRERI